MWLADVLLWMLIVGLDRMLTGRRFSPLAIFATSWLGTLALRHLNLIDYEPASATMILFFYGSLLAFATGYFLFTLGISRFWAPLRGQCVATALPTCVLGRVALGACCIGVVAAAVEVRSVIANRGLIGFLIAPLAVREEFTLLGWGVIYQINALVPCLLVLRHRASGRRVDAFALVLGGAAMIALVLANQKQAIVKAVVMASIVATLFEDRIRMKYLVGACIGMLLFFIGYTRITSPYYFGDHRFYVRDGHIHLPQMLAPLGNPYHYMTSGYGNFTEYYHDLEHNTDGEQTARPMRYIWMRLKRVSGDRIPSWQLLLCPTLRKHAYIPSAVFCGLWRGGCTVPAAPARGILRMDLCGDCTTETRVASAVVCSDGVVPVYLVL